MTSLHPPHVKDGTVHLYLEGRYQPVSDFDATLRYADMIRSVEPSRKYAHEIYNALQQARKEREA